MKSEKWKVKSEEWKVKNEKWRVKNEKWKVKNEKWRVKSEKWKVKNEELIFYFFNDAFAVFIEATNMLVNSLLSEISFAAVCWEM